MYTKNLWIPKCRWHHIDFIYYTALFREQWKDKMYVLSTDAVLFFKLFQTMDAEPMTASKKDTVGT